MDFPFIVFGVSLVTLWISAETGAMLRRRRKNMEDDEREDFSVILAATLTLLGLIIGFSFSMAVTRYDLRKNYEEAEANAIGTEYVRAGLLPQPAAARVRELLQSYLQQRLLFYTTHSQARLRQIGGSTVRLQNDLWLAVQAPALALPTPVVALAVAGMNDVLNSQGYTQAAWWNRIPTAAWALMGAIAICCNFLAGYCVRRFGGKTKLCILPMIVSISFLLIADIDSPRGGLIRVNPHNLESVSQSLYGP